MEKCQDYYYMSVGLKSYYYTLNYCRKDFIYSHDGEGNYDRTPVDRHHFIRNLSHDFEEAVEKAKQWHKENGGGLRMALMSSPNAMSEREKAEYLKRLERIKEGKFNSGQHKNQYVKDVPKSYVHWMICNVYNPNKSEEDQHLSAQICYTYADEQGWIDEWAEKGRNKVFPPNYETEVNNLINDEVMLCGKYRETPISDFIYTKKKTFRVREYEYLIWMAQQNSLINRIIKRFELKPELMEDGKEYYTLTNEHFLSYAERMPDTHDLSTMLVNNWLAENDTAHKYPKFRIQWDALQTPVHELIKFCPRSEVE